MKSMSTWRLERQIKDALAIVDPELLASVEAARDQLAHALKQMKAARDSALAASA